MPDQNLVGSNYKPLTNNERDNDIHIVLFSEFPLSYPGGGERLIRLIYHYMLKANIDTEIVENTKKENSSSVVRQYTDLNIFSLEFKRFGLIKFLYQDLPPLDIIPSDKGTVSLLFIRRIPPRKVLSCLEKSKVKVIFCLHGVALEKIRVTNPLIIAHQILLRIKLRDLAQHIKNNSYVQSLLPMISSRLVDLGADPKNIFTIENQFESDVSSPERNDEEFQVTFIGRMEDLQKGIKRLKKVIQLVGRLNPKIKFNVIGSGKDIRILNGLDRNCKIYKGIDDLTKNKIIAYSNLALVTSNLEPYPRVILEFLTSGVPVVTTPASGPSYILSKDASFGKVASFNPHALAESIVYFYNLWETDKDSYFDQRKLLCSRARCMFNSDKMLASYREMIINVATKIEMSKS